jgi:putrescine aminotransferase
LGGYGALNTGHNHPLVLEAVRRVEEVPNIIQASLNALAAALAHNLAQITPGDLQVSFFGNSGAEAVEGALKLSRAATGKTRFIYAEGSFHGKSFGALSVTGRSKYQEPFKPLLADTAMVPYGELAPLEKELKKGNTAAVIVEPIQGEGGVIVPPDGYLKGAKELCAKYGALLIVDEIQTGFGRTGEMFACQHDGVAPDIMCVAKSLGGGVIPIGAFITTEKIWKAAYGGPNKALLHTSTFGGNSRATAAGIAALEVIRKENLPERAKTMGEYLMGRLRELKAKYPMIKDVQGRGLLIGLEFEKPAQGLMAKLGGSLVNKFAEEYLGAMVAGELMNRHQIITAYTLNNPNVIRLEPPLMVTKEQVDRVVMALDDIFSRNKGLLSMAMSTAKAAVGAAFGRE